MNPMSYHPLQQSVCLCGEGFPSEFIRGPLLNGITGLPAFHTRRAAVAGLQVAGEKDLHHGVCRSVSGKGITQEHISE